MDNVERPDENIEWLSHGSRDIHAARTLLNGGDYEWALVLCQQAIEKTLKALVLHNTGEMPPRIHRLLALAELARVKFPEESEELVSAASISSMLRAAIPTSAVRPKSSLTSSS